MSAEHRPSIVPRNPSVSATARKMNEHAPHDGTEGFTLLDALVALAILGSVMMVVPKGLATARQTQDRSTEWLEARTVAQIVLEQELAGRSLQPGVYGGMVANRAWRAVLVRDPNFAVARSNEDDERHALLDAHLSVAMKGSPLEMDTLLVGVLP